MREAAVGSVLNAVLPLVVDGLLGGRRGETGGV